MREKPAHIAKAGADGVIISSKIVGIIEDNLKNKKKCLNEITSFIGKIRAAL
ncbi:MAG: hypothetical protein ABSB91_03185 [Sedimentisphaerales bacterium]